MTGQTATLLDISGAPASAPELWPPLLVAKAQIDSEIERLASIERPADGRRATAVIHPNARAPGLGFAPGVSVTISVLNPGESAAPVRTNASQVEICIGGAGALSVQGRDDFAVEPWDVWNLPSMKTYRHRCEGDRPFVRLSYSNAPLLEKLGVAYQEIDPAASTEPDPGDRPQARRRDAAANFQIGSGAWLRGYEYLVDIDVVESPANLWSWREVAPHLAVPHGDRPLGMFLLYNPATERRNGTSPSFFATLTHMNAHGRRPNPARGHRHVSSAINYHLLGHGYSVVDGQRVDWRAGDLLLSAPGWSEHAHYTASDEEMLVLTIQDHPLHIGMDSLLWQEDMSGPILALGSQPGFNSAAPRGVG